MSIEEMAPLVNKLEMDRFIKTEIEQAETLMKTSADTAIDVELQDLGPQLITKPGGYPYENDSDDGGYLELPNEPGKKEENKVPKAFIDAGVDLEKQEFGTLPNNSENNGDSQSPQAVDLDEFNISEKRPLDSILDLNLPPLRESRNNGVRHTRYTCELVTLYVMYFGCLFLAFGYAVYNIWVPIVYSIIQKSKESNETLEQ